MVFISFHNHAPTSALSESFEIWFPVLKSAKLTPCSRSLPEKLTVPELVKKFPAFYGNRRFITAFTTARRLSLLRNICQVFLCFENSIIHDAVSFWRQQYFCTSFVSPCFTKCVSLTLGINQIREEVRDI